MRPDVTLGALLAGAVIPLAPAAAADWSAEVTIVSDYRYRGVSLSGGGPAVQASIAAELESGVYGELWASRIEGGDVEIDATAGYAVPIADGLAIDVSATYYAYPADPSDNALEVSAEVEFTRGPITATVGASIAPPQRGTRDEDGHRKANVYVSAGARYELRGTPFDLHARMGRESGPWAVRGRGAKTDYSVGIGADFENASVSVDIVGSNAGRDALVGALTLSF